jgi:hypothetical protein
MGSVADALDGADLSAITAQFGGGLKLRWWQNSLLKLHA